MNTTLIRVPIVLFIVGSVFIIFSFYPSIISSVFFLVGTFLITGYIIGFEKISLDNNKRVAAISVYLLMLVLLTTSLKSFFPDMSNSTTFKDFNNYSYLVSFLYGIDLFSIILYFIWCQKGTVEDDHEITNIFDTYLMYNLFLIGVAFLLTLWFSTYFINAQNHSVPPLFSTVYGRLLGDSQILGIPFMFYTNIRKIYDMPNSPLYYWMQKNHK